MPDAEKRAFVNALNGLDDKDKLKAMMLTVDLGYIRAEINGTAYIPDKFNYADLSKRVEEISTPPRCFIFKRLKNKYSYFLGAI